MAHRNMTPETWAKLLHTSPDGKLTIKGVSPNVAAVVLGISRQAVHQAIRKNRLDAIRIVAADGTTSAIFIRQKDLNRFQRARSLSA